MRRLLLALLAVTTTLIVTGLISQAMAEARDRRVFPAPGRLIDVGDYRLHLQATGTNGEAPVVLLDSAFASATPQWGWIQPELAREMRVVSIDRPGMGHSDPAPGSVDARPYVEDLHAALQQIGSIGPYVLVAHSMGSLTTRAFAMRYPDEVAGMVLVDPRDLDIVTFSREIVGDPSVTSAAPSWSERWLPRLAARLGIMRQVDMLGEYVDQLPAESSGAARAMMASTRFWDSFIPDALLGESAVALLGMSEQHGDVPLIVLSAGEPNSAFPGAARTRFTALHARMAASLSAHGEHRVVTHANHYTIVTGPEYAAAVVAAVRDVAAAAR
jgi:pimeloyl-ACP methyl ester carboxylesterase